MKVATASAHCSFGFLGAGTVGVNWTDESEGTPELDSAAGFFGKDGKHEHDRFECELSTSVDMGLVHVQDQR